MRMAQFSYILHITCDIKKSTCEACSLARFAIRHRICEFLEKIVFMNGIVNKLKRSV